MDKLVVGILAHVDAGKTTLSEGLLYTCGRLKKLGRVDHQDAFLDTDPMERARGITIFSKQAVLPVDGAELTLLDTPGHADFSSEMERTLQVLDCAILVISGTDGVQGHTHTLWRLLERYGVPTFLFVNKMDLAGADKAALLAGLKAGLDEGCVDFTAPAAERDEAAALCGEDALERYLEDGALDGDTLTALIARRRLFPCWFGSALKLEGVAEFLQGLVAYAPRPRYGPDFAARVFKISRDNQGNRLTWMKLTGGALRVKEALSGPGWTEKADQLRVYSGSRFQTVDEAQAGSVVAVTGLSRTAAGEGLGAEAEALPPALEPVLIYQVLLPEGQDPHAALGKLLLLEEEDPQLHLVWNERLREIHIQLMDSPGAGGPALRPGDHLRPRRHRLPGDHRRPGGGRGPLRAPAPLCRGSPAAGAAPPGERPGAGRRLPPGHAGRELAAAGAHPSGGEAPPGGAHRLPHHRCAHHPGGGAGPP
jgi:ribosomal protection tetracycline resistance protein